MREGAGFYLIFMKFGVRDEYGKVWYTNKQTMYAKVRYMQKSLSSTHRCRLTLCVGGGHLHSNTLTYTRSLAHTNTHTHTHTHTHKCMHARRLSLSTRRCRLTLCVGGGHLHSNTLTYTRSLAHTNTHTHTHKCMHARRLSLSTRRCRLTLCVG